MTKFEEFVRRKRQEYGSKFDSSDLATEFIPYFNSQQRVRVKFSYGEEKNGRIGVTTGWKPVFLLMKASHHAGSSDTLSKKDHVVGVVK